MTITKAQLRTLRLLNDEAAHRVYHSRRSAADYTWMHKRSNVSLTPTLHKLFSRGYAAVSADNNDVAVITEKGRAVIHARVSC
jgi:hypothetical protein